MKKFNIPEYYRSKVISTIKEYRKSQDPRKQDFSPTSLDFGKVEFLIARHFGFCYGVENAIEIAFTALEENPGKKVYLLSEMIHNPGVNEDLQSRGIRFILDTKGNQLIPWDEITSEDVVIIPAFGTTLEIETMLKEKGCDQYLYNTTCPFVEKVWKKASTLGESNHTIVIHGKYNHEETRATFSHTVKNSPAVIVRDIEETKTLGKIISGEIDAEEFYELFKGRYSEGFNVSEDLVKIGVVNQTTMLASETQEIAEYLKDCMIAKYGISVISEHYSDTRDTLCYATYDNQRATSGLLNENADFAIVVGGYNSSNTTHLVELLEEKFDVYFISSSNELCQSEISYFDIHSKKVVKASNYIPIKKKVRIIITSGASCPDKVVDDVILKLLEYFDIDHTINELLENFA